MIIAVTGSICSGKSTVAGLMGRILSVDTIDADKICRQLLEKGKDGWVEMVDQWGDRYLTAEDEVDRARLRKDVFENVELRKQLEAILHPLARQEIRKATRKKDILGESLIVEVPLLFEVGWQGDFDRTVLVYANADVCLERVCTRDGVSRQCAGKILAAQMDIEQKKHLADLVIDNSGSWFRTALQLYRLKRRGEVR